MGDILYLAFILLDIEHACDCNLPVQQQVFLPISLTFYCPDGIFSLEVHECLCFRSLGVAAESGEHQIDHLCTFLKELCIHSMLNRLYCRIHCLH